MADAEPGQPAPLPLAEFTAEIVGAYVGYHPVAMSDLPLLITTIGQNLATLGQEPAEKEEDKPSPAVPIGKSVTPDHTVHPASPS